jgi:hypothetical protein
MSSGFISWLKAAGQEVLKAFGYVQTVGKWIVGVGAPIAEAALPMYAPLIAEGADALTVVGKYIVWIEGAASAFLGTANTLEQRLAAIQPYVKQAIQAWFAANFPGTAKVANQSLFEQGCGEIGRGVSDVLASLKSAAGVATMTAAAVGTDALTIIAKYIHWAEFTGAAFLGDAAKTGPQKFAAIQADVQAAVKGWLDGGLAGTAEITDQAKFQLGAGEISQGVVDILNSLGNAPATTQPIKAA